MNTTGTAPKKQSIMYVPLQVNRSKIILLIVQEKNLKSYCWRCNCPNLVQCTRLCGRMFITQPDFQLTESVGRKLFQQIFKDDLKIFKDYCPRNLFSGSNFSPEKSLQKNLSRKISRFFVSKISPATGVTPQLSDLKISKSESTIDPLTNKSI